MPRRSKVELSPETIAELEEQFYNFLHSLSPEETNKFFKEFLTTEEKMMMYKRLALYWSLFEGYSLASIQRMLGITHDTTRIYNKRKNEMSSDFKNLLHRIGRDENGQPLNKAVTEENNKEEQTESKEEDAPVVLRQAQDEIVEETITVVEEVITQEPQKNEEKAEEKNESEPIQTEESSEVKHEEMEARKENQEEDDQKNEVQMDTKSENEEEENTDENPEKKKKGFGRFFGF